ncbi:putative receptor like protein 25 [Humulus lupulus]|uniref:putative receptor like protein 25 n=1 Tax=Humulus lupulus TaxID=3486 RepID=UPI002B40D8CA|nr:putative receptor like protein 25 [Humulus lupulus]
MTFNTRYYQNVVTVTFKGLEMNLQKILTLFTSIDLSGNHLVGSKPEETEQLRALYVLNLSGNALTGRIPSSIGNLEQLESLDLSNNKLNGSIPSTLVSLSCLSFLNLSYNDLSGLIPSDNQIQTFPPESFVGNKGLWVFPLTGNYTKRVFSQNTTKENDSKSENGIDWNFISVEIGFIVGFRVVIVPLVYCKRWNKRYFDRIDDASMRLFPQLYQTSFNKSKRRRRHP